MATPKVALARGRTPEPKDESCDVSCTKIKDGILETSDGELITRGYDKWGYNYQKHRFSGFPANANREGDVVTEGNVHLKIKWNDAFISNKSCDGDLLLDTHFGFDTYIGSGAWFTNRFSGSYVGDDGRDHKWWQYFKIVAKPNEEYSCREHGGSEVMEDFCIVKNKLHDPYGGLPDTGFFIDGQGIFAPGPGRNPGPGRDQVRFVMPVN
jgi:hypothetical protein